MRGHEDRLKLHPLSKKDIDFLDMIREDKDERDLDYIEYIQHIIEKKLLKEEKLIKHTTDFDKKILVISQSLIKKFLRHGNEIDHCPQQIYRIMIKKDIQGITTLSMLKGLYFESLCLGSSAGGQKVTDLPRKNVSEKTKREAKTQGLPEPIGEKTADQLRIEEQALIFKQKCQEHGVIVISDGPNKNVQIEGCQQWIDPKYKTFEEWVIYLKVEADLISPIKYGRIDYPMAIIDTKLTKDRESTFGDFCWGSPEKMDKIQGLLYSKVLGLPFVNWVWDYVADDEKRGEKIIPVKTIPDDTEEGREVATRMAELDETIRKTIQYLIQYHMEEWPCKPTYQLCKECPLNPKLGGKCEYVDLIQEI